MECLFVGERGDQGCGVVELGVLIDKGRGIGRINGLAAVVEYATTDGEDLEDFVAWRCLE